MKNVLKAKYAGDLFSNDSSKIKIEYRNLIKAWHPDINENSKESNEAMSIINLLYKKGKELIKAREWEKTNYIALKTINNKTFEITFRREFSFELGKFYVCDNSIVFLIEKQYKSYYDNYKNILSQIKYPNDKIKKEFEMALPKINLEFETTEYYVMKINKEENTFSLIDIHQYYNQEIPHEHFSWILSRLYSFACLLEYNGISHNGLTIESIFINPEHHGVFIYGGWWFSCKIGDSIKGLPKKISKLIPYSVIKTSIADRKIDLETIKLIGRQLLGDEHGTKILKSSTVPLSIKEWILDKCGKTAFGDYHEWESVLVSAYNKRKFTKMEITKNILYEEKE